MNVDLIIYGIKKLFCLVSAINCGHMKGIVIPSGFGSTTQSKELETKDQSTLLIDLVSAVDLSLGTDEKDKLNQAKKSNDYTSYNSIYYPLAKQWLENLRKNFKNKSIILLCADYKLLKYVGVRDITYLLPSQKLIDSQCSKLSQVDAGKVVQIKNSVMDILKHKGMKSLIFSTFDELQIILKDIAELRSKI